MILLFSNSCRKDKSIDCFSSHFAVRCFSSGNWLYDLTNHMWCSGRKGRCSTKKAKGYLLNCPFSYHPGHSIFFFNKNCIKVSTILSSLNSTKKSSVINGNQTWGMHGKYILNGTTYLWYLGKCSPTSISPCTHSFLMCLNFSCV